MRRRARSTLGIVIALALAVPGAALGKRNKKPKEEAPPPPEAATFEVYGKVVQHQAVYGFGAKLDCDLFVYLVEDGAPVTDATVTVAGQALPHDAYFEGRYRLQQSCVETGTPLTVEITRGNQAYSREFGAMIGYPTIQTPAAGAEVSANGDLAVSWTAADGAARYAVAIEGVDQHWTTDGTELTVPSSAVPPYQHHKVSLTAYGAAVDLNAAARPLPNAEPVWPGLTAVTSVRREFDFGPWLVDQNWVGDAVIQWWEDGGKTLDEDLFKVWLLLSSGGSYVINRVKIGVFELAMYEGRDIEWEPHDTGSFRIGESGDLLLESSDSEGMTWTGSYADGTLTLLKVLSPTDDSDEKRRRRFQGAPKPWPLTVQDVEPAEF